MFETLKTGNRSGDEAYEACMAMCDRLCEKCVQVREVARLKFKKKAVLFTTSKENWDFKSGATPLWFSLTASLRV